MPLGLESDLYKLRSHFQLKQSEQTSHGCAISIFEHLAYAIETLTESRSRWTGNLRVCGGWGARIGGGWRGEGGSEISTCLKLPYDTATLSPPQISIVKSSCSPHGMMPSRIQEKVS